MTEIDQHARQITISLRDEHGDVMQVRQEKIQAFFAKLTRECVRDGESFIALLEVCGFNALAIEAPPHQP